MKPFQSHTHLKIAATALFFVTTACGGTITAITPSHFLETTVAQTLQAASPVASASPTLSIVSPLPSLTSQPAITSTSAPPPRENTSSLPAATRIRFASGATSSVTQGTVQAGQALYYVVKASANQPMIVSLHTPDNSALLSVFSADGTVLLSRAQQSSTWQGYLLSTQDYYFRVTGGASAQNFTLNVSIPARIEFDPGEDQITLSGTTVGGYAVAYTAYAFGGQEMDVTINTSQDVAALTLWGFSDGQPYARAQNGITDFSMTLPSTQDYIIEVVPRAGSVVDYQVTVQIR